MSIAPVRYEKAVAEGAEAIAHAVERGPSEPVPGCPGWDVEVLARHVGSLYARVAEMARRGSHEPLRREDTPSAPGEAPALASWLRDGSVSLLMAFAATEQDAPAGRWRDRPVSAGFWRRRLAHETVVHRLDAEEALGAPSPLDGELAADGIDEVFELFLPFSRKKEDWPPPGALWLADDDGRGEWWVEPKAPDEVEVRREPPGDGSEDGRFARVAAPAAELFLVSWGRRRPKPATVSGDARLLGQWLGVLGW